MNEAKIKKVIAMLEKISPEAFEGLGEPDENMEISFTINDGKHTVTFAVTPPETRAEYEALKSQHTLVN